MAYFLFVDESGQDHRASPYEVLAGITVEDRDTWNLVTALQDAEVRIFDWLMLKKHWRFVRDLAVAPSPAS